MEYEKIALILHLLVRLAHRPQKLRAPLLEVNKIVGMMQQPHLVRLRIADTNLDFAGVGQIHHSKRNSHLRCGINWFDLTLAQLILPNNVNQVLYRKFS